VRVVTSGTVPALPMTRAMTVDLLMGVAALLLGLALAGFSAPLADLMREGDERLREQHPWVQAYEPQAGPLATAVGRWWILRSWLLISSAGFVSVGAALVLRALAA
jgi:hypothetical protein